MLENMTSKKDFIESFINEWYRYESLWNVKSELYKNRDEKTKSVNALASMFEISGETYQFYHYF